MDRINLPFFCDIGVSINALATADAKTATAVDLLVRLLGAGADIATLLDTYSELTICRPAGQELMELETELIEWFRNANPDQQKAGASAANYKLTLLPAKAQSFNTVLRAELQSLAAYAVRPKGIYATDALIERASSAIPESFRTEIPIRAIDELDSAGRCIAFDLPTAAGFHSMRAAEVVVKLYCSEFGTTGKQKDWGAYVKSLETTSADKKVIATLDQIRVLHRNPTIHPDAVLSLEDAEVLFNITQSAIVGMVKDMVDNSPKRKKSSAPASQSGTGSNAP